MIPRAFMDKMGVKFHIPARAANIGDANAYLTKEGIFIHRNNGM